MRFMPSCLQGSSVGAAVRAAWGCVRGAARTPRLCPRPAGGYVALGRGPSRAEATDPEGESWVPGVEVPLRSRFPRSIRVVPQPAFPPILDRPPQPHSRTFPLSPATTHKVEGSFHHFHRPRGERRPEAKRRRQGTWRGRESRRRGVWRTAPRNTRSPQ